MAKNSGHTRGVVVARESSAEQDSDYYQRSKELVRLALANAGSQVGEFPLNNVIQGTLDITKSDIRNITGKNFVNNRFNVLKNMIAQDIRGFIEQATYEGWREVEPGKHPESVYFVYYSKELGVKAYLCV